MPHKTSLREEAGEIITNGLVMSLSHQFSLPWNDREFANFGLIAQVNRHRYHELPLFNRESLIAFLDKYPRELLRCYRMGTDLEKPEQWQVVDITPELSGEGIWRAVEKGRLWVNILQVEENSAELAELIKHMYAQVEEKCPHLKSPRPALSNLLISSPGAMVYYHLDAEPNMLWHFQGEKHIWVYPEMDLNFVSQQNLENIYAGVSGENLPYRPEFDNHATCFKLKPGDVASWPHNAPHRIVNIDLNVSLATSYYTDSIYKRKFLQLANKYIVRRLGGKAPLMREDGIMAACKRMSFRLLNKIRPFKNKNRVKKNYLTDLLLDPEQNDGVLQLEMPVKPYFAEVRDQAVVYIP